MGGEEEPDGLIKKKVSTNVNKNSSSREKTSSLELLEKTYLAHIITKGKRSTRGPLLSCLLKSSWTQRRKGISRPEEVRAVFNGALRHIKMNSPAERRVLMSCLMT